MLTNALRCSGEPLKDSALPDYSFAQIDGVATAYRRAGSGDPVLLLHGVGSYSYIWRKIVPLLADRFDVIAPDLAGCGYSEAQQDQALDLRAQYERIDRLMQHLGVERAHVVGHDFGGAIAQLVAIDHSERVRTLMLVNSIGYDYWPVRAIKTARFPIVRQLTLALLDRTVFATMLRRAVHSTERITAEIVNQYKAPYRSVARRRALMRFLRALDHRYLVSRVAGLRALTVPTCVVRSKHDAYLNRAISLRLAQDIPNATLVEVDMAGHFIQEDQPEQIVQLFLDLVGGNDEPQRS